MTRFLILSDIHACDEDPSSSQAPSYVSSFNPAARARLDPLSDLEHLIAGSNLAPDYILCAGDITNKSNPAAFNYTWRRLHDLSKNTSAKLISTVGNHDLDSRFQANRYDPKGYAMSLSPGLPVEERINYLEFWAQNFTLMTFDDCNIAVVNTAAYHGYGQDIQTEIEHGRISDVTLERLETTLRSAEKRATNILLCHHHPIRGDQGDENLDGLTRGGEKLIDLMGRVPGPWIIVHGHKHVPDLFYGHGGGNAPVVLGSASFSAQVNRDAQNKNPNQVHLLISRPDDAAKLDLASAGFVKSWTWQAGVGWVKALGTMGLPYETGFGYKGSVAVLASKLLLYLKESDAPFISWAEALIAVPSISHLVPTDFETLRTSMRELGLTILNDEHGEYAQIGLRT